MPSEKKKAKKVKKLVKTELTEIQPIGHYVDDRLELITQVFSCLKAKTVKSFAPEFLSVIFFYYFFYSNFIFSDFRIIPLHNYNNYAWMKCLECPRKDYCPLLIKQSVQQIQNPVILMLKKLKVRIVNFLVLWKKKSCSAYSHWEFLSSDRIF